jgi:hypothetical protein
MRKTKQKPVKKNYATPGEPMTEAEFKSFVKEAEEGPFLSEKEFKRKFEVWKKTLEK